MLVLKVYKMIMCFKSNILIPGIKILKLVPNYLHRDKERELVRKEEAAWENLAGSEVDVAGISRERECMHVTVRVIDDADSCRQLVQCGHRFFQEVHWL